MSRAFLRMSSASGGSGGIEAEPTVHHVPLDLEVRSVVLVAMESEKTRLDEADRFSEEENRGLEYFSEEKRVGPAQFHEIHFVIREGSLHRNLQGDPVIEAPVGSKSHRQIQIASGVDLVPRPGAESHDEIHAVRFRRLRQSPAPLFIDDHSFEILALS